jgi:hypothetical protein
VDVMVVQEDVAESTPFAFRASSNSKNPSDSVRLRPPQEADAVQGRRFSPRPGTPRAATVPTSSAQSCRRPCSICGRALGDSAGETSNLVARLPLPVWL